MTAIDRLHRWAVAQPFLRVMTLMVRVGLAVGFLPSGLVKILNEPFTTLPTSDPVGFFFAGFFSAHLYYRFIGVAQWTAAGLLLMPRTATLGAVLYLPIILNIFVITVAIGPSFALTRVITGAMLVAAIYLLFWDWDRWKQILPAVAPDSRHGHFTTILGLMIAAVIGFRGVVSVHLARLRHQPYVLPAAAVGLGALLGAAMLVVAYRRARERDGLL